MHVSVLLGWKVTHVRLLKQLSRFSGACAGLELFRPGLQLGPGPPDAARCHAGALAPPLHPVPWLSPPPGEPAESRAGVLALSVLGYPGYMQQGSFWYEISLVMNWRWLKLFAWFYLMKWCGNDRVRQWIGLVTNEIAVDTAPELVSHTVALPRAYPERAPRIAMRPGRPFSVILADAGSSVCWEALLTQRFLLRFTWRWRMRLSALARHLPVRATSTWTPSWMPSGTARPKLWVRRSPSAAAVSYVVSGTLEFVFKKKKKGKKSDRKCGCSSCHMSEMWPNPLLGGRGFVASGRVGLWSRRWLLGSAFTPGSSFSSFPNLLGEGKKK